MYGNSERKIKSLAFFKTGKESNLSSGPCFFSYECCANYIQKRTARLLGEEEAFSSTFKIELVFDAFLHSQQPAICLALEGQPTAPIPTHGQEKEALPWTYGMPSQHISPTMKPESTANFRSRFPEIQAFHFSTCCAYKLLFTTIQTVSQCPKVPNNEDESSELIQHLLYKGPLNCKQLQKSKHN